MRTLAVIGVLIAVFVGWREWRARQLEQRLARIAAEISQRPAKIRCQGFFARLTDVTNVAGSVRFENGQPSDTAYLQSGTCDRLRSFGETRRRTEFACVRTPFACGESVEKTVRALLVLAHESAHLSGIQSESHAQCVGIQRIALVAERLGSPHDEARAIGIHFLLLHQPHASGSYQLTADCQDGGVFDVEPAAGWPTP